MKYDTPSPQGEGWVRGFKVAKEGWVRGFKVIKEGWVRGCQGRKEGQDKVFGQQK